MTRYFLFKEWIANLRARPLVTILAVFFAAGGLAGSAALHTGLKDASRWWENRFAEPHIEVFLQAQVTEDTAQTLAARLAILPQIEQARYVSKEDARREAEAYLGPLAFSVLPENPLVPSIRLVLKPGVRSQYETRRLVDSFIGLPGVSEVVSADEQLAVYVRGCRIIDQYRTALVATSILWTISWLFCGVFLILRVRADHTKVWQYLGMPPGRLRWPSIAEGLTLGACSAVLGLLLIRLAVQPTWVGVSAGLGSTEYSAVLGIPPVAGALAGWLAFRVHRRKVS